MLNVIPFTGKPNNIKKPPECFLKALVEKRQRPFCRKGLSSIAWGALLNNIPGPQEKWSNETYNTSISLGGDPTLQDGGHYKLRDLLRSGDWMVKDAYFTISIHPHHCRFLRFRVEGHLSGIDIHQGNEPLMTPLRSCGVRIIVYIDDMLILERRQLNIWKCYFFSW